MGQEREFLEQSPQSAVSRIKVDGGWIYTDLVIFNEIPAISTVFVPDVDLTRYQSHLRDAYKQGYDQGHSDAKRGLSETVELPVDVIYS